MADVIAFPTKDKRKFYAVSLVVLGFAPAKGVSDARKTAEDAVEEALEAAGFVVDRNLTYAEPMPEVKA